MEWKSGEVPVRAGCFGCAGLALTREPCPRQSQSQSQRPKLTLDQERKGVNRVVRLMLCKDESKKAVAKSDITAALKADGVPAGTANIKAILEKATTRLMHVFGFELVEVDRAQAYADATFSQHSQVL